jgi:hypothetical protein
LVIGLKVSAQTNDGDSFFGASESPIEHITTAAFSLLALLGQFRHLLSSCGDRPKDTLASSKAEGERTGGFLQEVSSTDFHGIALSPFVDGDVLGSAP